MTLSRRGLATSPATILGFQVLVWLPWALLTPLILRAAQRFPFARGQRILNGLRHLAFGALVTGAVLTYVAVLESINQSGVAGLAPTALSQWFGRIAAGNSVLYFLLYWAVLGCCMAFAAFRTLEHRERSHLVLETQLALAQLDALESQLQPHFLFNTLHSVSALIDDDPAGARRMLARLAELLRASLRRGPVQEVSLAEELELLDLYLQIERTRFGSRLAVEQRCQPQIQRALVPYLILQPLVENAIRHGLSADPTGGRIIISAQRHDEVLTLSVVDDGSGPPVESPKDLDEVIDDRSLPARRSGIGLSNSRERLKTLYPGAATLDLRALPDGGTEARVTLPYREAETPER